MVTWPDCLDVRLHLGPKTTFLLLSDSCKFVHVGLPSLTRERVCRLQFLLALASAVILTTVKISSLLSIFNFTRRYSSQSIAKSLVPCGNLIFTVLHVTIVHMYVLYIQGLA
jgi:hypothetical protein